MVEVETVGVSNLADCEIGDHIFPIYMAVRQGDFDVETSHVARQAAAVAAAVAEMERSEQLTTINPIQKHPPPGYGSGEPHQHTTIHIAPTEIEDFVPEEVRYVGHKKPCLYRYYIGCRTLLALWVFFCLSIRLVAVPPALLFFSFIFSFIYCICGSRNRSVEVESFKAVLTINHFIVHYEEFIPETCCADTDESTVCCISHSHQKWDSGTKLTFLKYVEIETCCCIETLNIYTGVKQTSCCGCDDPDLQLICMEDAKGLQRQLLKARNDCREMIVPSHPAYDLIAGKPKV